MAVRAGRQQGNGRGIAIENAVVSRGLIPGPAGGGDIGDKRAVDGSGVGQGPAHAAADISLKHAVLDKGRAGGAATRGNGRIADDRAAGKEAVHGAAAV